MSSPPFNEFYSSMNSTSIAFVLPAKPVRTPPRKGTPLPPRLEQTSQPKFYFVRELSLAASAALVRRSKVISANQPRTPGRSPEGSGGKLCKKC